MDPSLGGPKQRLVLALLLAEPNTVVPIDRLVDGLWGSEPPESARHTVQAYVSELRKVVGSVIEREGAGYRVRVNRETLDALDFEGRVEDAGSLLASDPEAASAQLEAALDLWHGTAFQDCLDQPTLQFERSRLDELRLVAIEALTRARLALGMHASVIADLERLTHEYPYREELRGFHMVALYRAGRQADALRAYQDTRQRLVDELGIEPSPRLRRLEEQILLQDPDLELPTGGSGAATLPDHWMDNPYLGLRAFREEDQARFFGQDELIERLLGRVMAESIGFTAVVGPSGSGKSSAVQAGLVPRLRREVPGIAVARMQPGSQPYAELEAALDALGGGDHESRLLQLREEAGLVELVTGTLHDGRLLLVVDQFEELFTMVEPAEAARFIASLVRATDDPAGRIHVLVTLRADFYDRPLAHPQFGRVFADNVVTVVPMTADQLEAAATLPARQLDIAVDPRLVGRLIADVAGQPNALPLFQYALTELFDERSGPLLDLATYERIGGVRKAVARRAESLYDRLDTSEKEAVRQLFLRIATVSGDIVGRRRVTAAALASMDVDVVALRAAIDVFVRYRLLAFDRDPTTGSPTVEVAHEAVLSEWHRLRDWIDQSRDDLAKHTAFVVAMQEWAASGEDPGYLLTGTRLEDYESWCNITRLRLTSTERAFIAAAVTARDEVVAGSAERADAEARLRRRSRRQLVVLFAVVAVLAAVVSYPILTRDPDPETIAAVLGAPRASSTFDELVARGVETAGDDLGFDTVVLEPPFTDFESDIRHIAATEPALIVAPALVFPDVARIAADFPRTTFVGIDWLDPPLAPNSVAVLFAVEQGSFLVGAAAALESETGRVGYIGANGRPHLESFRAGFEQGARSVDPDIEIVSELIAAPAQGLVPDGWGYQVPAVARRIASSMYLDHGVDIIFVAAGQSGLGVVEAATELSEPGRKLWMIGVDSDEHFNLPADQRAHVLSSMVKRVDTGVEVVATAYEAGTLVSPSQLHLTLADGAVGYTDSGGHLQASTIDRLEAYEREIIDGFRVVDPRPRRAVTESDQGPVAKVTFDGTICTYEGPDEIAAGLLQTFVFVNAWDQPSGSGLVKVPDGTTLDEIADRGLANVVDLDAADRGGTEAAPGETVAFSTYPDVPGDYHLDCWEPPDGIRSAAIIRAVGDG